MKIISWNVNGIRAVERKEELHSLLHKHNPDILLLQETKATPDKLSKALIEHPEYHQFYCSAKKPGYAGTAIWIRRDSVENVKFSTGMPNYTDTEGRICRADFGQWTILSVYFPNGGKSPEAWKDKLVFYKRFLEYIDALRNEGRKVVWGGDVNCAHEEIDIARPKENQNSIGFLPEERAWISEVIAHNWVDVYRYKYPDTVVYSWWHVRSGARARNVGWRIDYFFVDASLLGEVEHIEYLQNQMGSDHCPVLLKMDMEDA